VPARRNDQDRRIRFCSLLFGIIIGCFDQIAEAHAAYVEELFPNGGVLADCAGMHALFQLDCMHAIKTLFVVGKHCLLFLLELIQLLDPHCCILTYLFTGLNLVGFTQGLRFFQSQLCLALPVHGN
jgi:hypothetical protein